MAPTYRFTSQSARDAGMQTAEATHTTDRITWPTFSLTRPINIVTTNRDSCPTPIATDVESVAPLSKV